MKNYTVVLTDAEDKALSFVALSQQEWIDNAVKNRCRIAIDDIVQICVKECLNTGTQIPGSKEEMVDLSFSKGWVKTLADIQTEIESSTQTPAQ